MIHDNVKLPTAREFLDYLLKAEQEGVDLNQNMSVYDLSTEEYYSLIDIQISCEDNSVVEGGQLVFIFNTL